MPLLLSTPGVLRIETPFEVGNPPLESAKHLEQLIEAAVEVVVLTAVFNLRGIKAGSCLSLHTIKAPVSLSMQGVDTPSI